jgi:hypothetical protein
MPEVGSGLSTVAAEGHVPEREQVAVVGPAHLGQLHVEADLVAEVDVLLAADDVVGGQREQVRVPRHQLTGRADLAERRPGCPRRR